VYPLIAIDGSGVAAVCCARLLQAKGFEIRLQNISRSGPSPTLLLNASTQRLLSEIFGTSDLFAGLHAINRRVVKWGKQPPVTFDHYGLVVTESVLLERLQRCINGGLEPSSSLPWLTVQSRFQAGHQVQQQFGSRMATATPVHITASCADSCWIESLDDGWLFLLPNGGESASLISVGGTSAELLDQSSLIRPQIESLEEERGRFPAHPRISEQLFQPSWLACGTAAMSFDPICGEGVGNAAREAILAAAVIQEVALTGEFGDAMAHYSSRLIAGFQRHLVSCEQFYRTAGENEWWKKEWAALNTGLGRMGSKLIGLPNPRYRLSGFELERIH
jgi:hypothetical protein